MNKTITHFEHPRQHHMVGDGFRVAQYIPGYGREMSPISSPFLMLDYNAPWKVEPQSDGYRPGVGFHPHRGFETVTIVYSWEIEHQDTAWHGGVIGPDEVQWMTAGSWLLHNEFMTERFARAGWVQHAVQLWVDLPKEYKMTAPQYQALTKENIPVVSFDGGNARVIAWELVITTQNWTTRKQSWVAKTFSQIELYDVIFETEQTLNFDLPEKNTAYVLVVSDGGEVEGKTLEDGDMVRLSQTGNTFSLSGKSHSRFLIMSGAHLGQSVVQYGPFVMNTREEIMEAFRDLEDGKMGKIPYEGV